MSIEFLQLNKSIGGREILKGVSFTAASCKVTGFLGVNGAGKSTTMKIAAGYLLADGGDIRIGGHSVCQEPQRTRRIVGYLSEDNPLYPHMYVSEFLGFVYQCFPGGRAEKHLRLEYVAEKCGIRDVLAKKIKTLSKGMRQRVGLAKALIADPEILILDEPTAGLDPNQVVEIRKLIQQVSATKTVLFSTHILSEVEEVCEKVVIIDNGSIVADGSKEALLEDMSLRAKEFTVTLGGPIESSLWKELNCLGSIKRLAENKFVVRPPAGSQDPESLRRSVHSLGLGIVDISALQYDLEDLFQRLTRDYKKNPRE